MKISVKTNKLYHLSESNLDGVELFPRIPDNFMTRNNYENNSIKRISFSTSIDGALTGISSNLDNKEFYIHEPNDYSNLVIKQITNDDVPDQSLTEEIWVLNPTRLKMIGKLKVINSKSKIYNYKYGEFTAETYRWNYIELKNEEN
ncbi:MAG: hypothetical protein PHI05_01270 [Bacilli bacterium]|nr:hypothetical protein [Bacilli bacterium]MDD4547358.1 hypothetical protein [Bacilli bacterium]